MFNQNLAVIQWFPPNGGCDVTDCFDFISSHVELYFLKSKYSVVTAAAGSLLFFLCQSLSYITHFRVEYISLAKNGEFACYTVHTARNLCAVPDETFLQEKVKMEARVIKRKVSSRHTCGCPKRGSY